MPVEATLRRPSSAYKANSVDSYEDSVSDFHSDPCLDPSAPRPIKELPRRRSPDLSTPRISTPVRGSSSRSNGDGAYESPKTSDSEDVPEVDTFSVHTASSEETPPTSLSPRAFDKELSGVGREEDNDAGSVRSACSDSAFRFTLPPSVRQPHSWDPMKAAPILIAAMLGDDEVNAMTMAQLKIASAKCASAFAEVERQDCMDRSTSQMVDHGAASDGTGAHSGNGHSHDEGMTDTDDGYDDLDQPWFEPHGNNKKRKSARSLPSRSVGMDKPYYSVDKPYHNDSPVRYERHHPDEDNEDYPEDMPVRYFIAKARLPLSKQASVSLRHRVRIRYARVRAAKALAKEEEEQRAVKAAKAAEEKDKKAPKRLSKAERRAVVRGGAGGKAPPKTTLAAIRARTAQNNGLTEGPTEVKSVETSASATVDKSEAAPVLIPPRVKAPSCRFTFQCASPISKQLELMRAEIDRFQARVCEVVDSSTDPHAVATHALASIDPQGQFAMPIAGVAMIATARLVATRQKTKMDPMALVNMLLKDEAGRRSEFEMNLLRPALEEELRLHAEEEHKVNVHSPQASSQNTWAKSTKSHSVPAPAPLSMTEISDNSQRKIQPKDSQGVASSAQAKSTAAAPTQGRSRKADPSPHAVPPHSPSSLPATTTVALQPSSPVPDPLFPPAQATSPPPPPKMSRRRKANMNNVHHRANYVPSRVPSSGGTSAGAQLTHKGALDAPPGLDHPTTSCSLFPDEWLCLFCEYELFYGEPPLLVRAAQRRKKLVANRRRARERAHKAAEGGSLAMTRDDGDGEDQTGEGEEEGEGKRVRRKKKVERCTCGKVIHDQKRSGAAIEPSHRHAALEAPPPLPSLPMTGGAGTLSISDAVGRNTMGPQRAQ